MLLCNVVWHFLLLGKTHADREEGRYKEDDIENPLFGRVEQHRGDVDWIGWN